MSVASQLLALLAELQSGQVCLSIDRSTRALKISAARVNHNTREVSSYDYNISLKELANDELADVLFAKGLEHTTHVYQRKV